MRNAPPVRLFTVAYAFAALAVMCLAFAYPAAALVVGAWVALAIAVRTLGRLAVSPALIVAAGLAIVGVAGRVLYPSVAGAPFAAGITLPPDPDLLNRGFYGMTAASLAVSTGAIVAGLLARAPGSRERSHPVQMSRTMRSLMVVCVPIPTLALIALHDFSIMLERDQYIPEGAGGGLAGLLKSALIVTLVVNGYLLRTQSGAARVLVSINILVSAAYLMASGSRLFAAIPLLVAVGYYLARMNRSSLWLLIAGAATTFSIVPLPLYWRSLNAHGLIPYFNSLARYTDTEFGIATTAKTILVSVPITGASATSKMPDGALPISVDPRGGETAGWYEIAPQMRLNIFTPTSGVGELLSQGTTVLVLFFLAVGLYLGFLDRHVRRALTRGHHLIAFAHVGLISLCLVYFIQYNLRLSMRMLYYSLAFWILYVTWAKVRPRFQSERPHPHYLYVANAELSQ